MNMNAGKSEVKSAKRVLEILRFFVAEKAPASLAHIASSLQIPKSSCLALLDTLEQEGYAYLVKGRYYLTGRWQQEAQIVSENDRLVNRLHPVLEEVQLALGETVILAKRDKTKVIYLDVVEGQQDVRYTAKIGGNKPLHSSSSGRALLSALSDDEIKEIAGTLVYQSQSNKAPRTPKALIKKIEVGRKLGWHVNMGEYQPDTLSVAVPLVLHGYVLALVVGAPMSRCAHKVNVMGALLAKAVHRVVHKLPAEDD